MLSRITRLHVGFAVLTIQQKSLNKSGKLVRKVKRISIHKYAKSDPRCKVRILQRGLLKWTAHELLLAYLLFLCSIAQKK